MDVANGSYGETASAWCRRTGHVGAIVDRCVDSDVTKRFGSVAEIVDGIESLPEGVKSAVWYRNRVFLRDAWVEAGCARPGCFVAEVQGPLWGWLALLALQW